MSSTCEYYKIEEKKYKANSENCAFNEGVSQIFMSGKCTHVECSEKAVSCYGMVELCQISDVGGKIKLP